MLVKAIGLSLFKSTQFRGKRVDISNEMQLFPINKISKTSSAY